MYNLNRIVIIFIFLGICCSCNKKKSEVIPNYETYIMLEQFSWDENSYKDQLGKLLKGEASELEQIIVSEVDYSLESPFEHTILPDPIIIHPDDYAAISEIVDKGGRMLFFKGIFKVAGTLTVEESGEGVLSEISVDPGYYGVYPVDLSNQELNTIHDEQYHIWWTLISIYTDSVHFYLPEEYCCKIPYLEFDKEYKMVKGALCKNGYWGQYELGDNNGINISGFGTNFLGCDGMYPFYEDYLRFLRTEASSYQIENNILTIYSDSTNTEFYFFGEDF